MEAAKDSIPGFRSRPVTFPVRPTRSAASRAIKPVPHAMSSTRSPGCGSVSATTSGAQGANTAGTSARSYVSAAFPVTCHWSSMAWASLALPSSPRSVSSEAIISGAVADAALWRTLRTVGLTNRSCCSPTDEAISQRRCYAAHGSDRGTFKTCRQILSMSVYGGRPEVGRSTAKTTLLTHSRHDAAGLPCSVGLEA